MGASATQGRRALIDLVKQCVTSNNNLAAKVEEVGEASNKLARQTGEDVASLKDRCNSLNAWCKRLEREMARDRVQIEMGADRHRAFATMTFRQRLVWLITGRCPFFPLPVPAGTTLDDVSRVWKTGSEPAASSPSVMPHTSMGPRVLP